MIHKQPFTGYDVLPQFDGGTGKKLWRGNCTVGGIGTGIAWYDGLHSSGTHLYLLL